MICAPCCAHAQIGLEWSPEVALRSKSESVIAEHGSPKSPHLPREAVTPEGKAYADKVRLAVTTESKACVT